MILLKQKLLNGLRDLAKSIQLPIIISKGFCIIWERDFNTIDDNAEHKKNSTVAIGSGKNIYRLNNPIQNTPWTMYTWNEYSSSFLIIDNDANIVKNSGFLL